MKKIISTPLAIIITVVFAVLVGGTVVWQYLKLPKEEGAPEVKPPEEVVTDEIINWKIYRDDEYKFKFKYPSEYTTIKEGNIVTFGIPEEPGPKLAIQTLNNPKQYSLYKFYSFYSDPKNEEIKNKEVGNGDVYNYYGDADSFELIEIDELPVAKFLGVDTFSAGRLQEITVLAIRYYNEIVEIVTPEDLSEKDKKIVETIISTFKILPREILPDEETIDWKVYTNKDYGYEIKYPELTTPRERELMGYLQNVIFSFSRDAAIFVFVESGLKMKCLLKGECWGKGYEKIMVGGEEMLIGEPAGSGYSIRTHAFKNGYVYRIELADYTGEKNEKSIKIYNQMLSTFRFLE